MSKRWYLEKKREHYYKQAKQSGYRARSAYKLEQVQKKFHILQRGDLVVDLGAAPGGWSQMAIEYIGSEGMLIGVDIQPIRPLQNAFFIQGDMTKEEVQQKVISVAKGRLADVIISDMSPDITGNYSMDQARSIWLCGVALDTVKKLLKTNGHFLCKIFEGEDTKEFIDRLKKDFGYVRNFSPDASRKTSSEIYVIAKSFKK